MSLNISISKSLLRARCRRLHSEPLYIYPYQTVCHYYYYYWYSALGPVWAETRVQSGDWYGSGTLHPGQVLRGSLPLLSPSVSYPCIIHYLHFIIIFLYYCSQLVLYRYVYMRSTIAGHGYNYILHPSYSLRSLTDQILYITLYISFYVY